VPVKAAAGGDPPATLLRGTYSLAAMISIAASLGSMRRQRLPAVSMDLLCRSLGAGPAGAGAIPG